MTCSEGKTDIAPEAVGNSPGTAEKMDGENVPAEPVESGPQRPALEVKPNLFQLLNLDKRLNQIRCEEPPPEHSGPTVEEVNAAVLSDSRRHTRRSFVVAAAAAAAGYGLYNWLDHLPANEMQPGGYRKAFETNAAISRDNLRRTGSDPDLPSLKI